MGKTLVKHRDLVRAVIDAVEVTEAAFCWKMQSGLFKTWLGKPAGHIGRPGVPDICGITKKGKFLGIEVKCGRDKQRQSQEAFEKKCDETGAHYIVVNEQTNLTNLVKLLCQL